MAARYPTPVFHHVGVYAYRPECAGRLSGLANRPAGTVWKGLEQLRFMENGRKVLCVEVEAKGRQFWELNNPQDVAKDRRDDGGDGVGLNIFPHYARSLTGLGMPNSTCWGST